MLGVGVIGIVHEPDGAWGFAGSGLVYVGHVHEVVLESGVVVVREAAAVGIADDDIDVRDGEPLLVALERLELGRRTCAANGTACGRGETGGTRRCLCAHVRTRREREAKAERAGLKRHAGC